MLVGVENKSGATVFGIQLSGPNVFEDDGDGAFGGQYPGPGTSFTIQNNDNAVVNFTNGLDNDGFLYFSLEGSPAQVKLSSTVAIDPGHGYSCAAVKQAVGAVGVTDFPTSDPPAGKLHEDDLTLAIGNQLQQQLASANYKVAMTKTDVQACPTFGERGQKANDAKSNIFVSIHINAAGSFPVNYFTPGVEVLYNSSKTSAKTLAELMTGPLSSSLGMNNRGAGARDDLAVLKMTVTRMTAVLAENGRLSGSDETILHSAGATGNAATGIKSGIDAFINQ